MQRQSKYVIAPLSMRWTAAAAVIFAPMHHCTGGGGGSGAGDGEAVGRRQGARRRDGGGRWQAIPPFAPIWLGRYVGLVSRNFFLSFGSPRSTVLADNDCVSCCVCVDRERVERKLYSF